MTFNEKLQCSTLTDDQHKRIIHHAEFLLNICFDEEELHKEYLWLVEFISSLHSMSFICPREVEKYRVYLKEKYEENMERIMAEAATARRAYDQLVSEKQLKSIKLERN